MKHIAYFDQFVRRHWWKLQECAIHSKKCIMHYSVYSLCIQVQYLCMYLLFPLFFYFFFSSSSSSSPSSFPSTIINSFNSFQSFSLSSPSTAPFNLAVRSCPSEANHNLHTCVSVSFSANGRATLSETYIGGPEASSRRSSA